MKIFNLKVETKKSGNAYYVAYYIINGKQKKFSSGVKCTGKKKDEKIAFDVNGLLLPGNSFPKMNNLF